MKNSKNIKVKKNKILKLSKEQKEEHSFEEIYKICRKGFQNKKEKNIFDLILYNIVRGKKTMQGIEKIRLEKHMFYEYFYLNYEPRLFDKLTQHQPIFKDILTKTGKDKTLKIIKLIEIEYKKSLTIEEDI